MKAFSSYLQKFLTVIFFGAGMYLLGENVSGSLGVYACYSGHVYCGITTVHSFVRIADTLVVLLVVIAHVLVLLISEMQHVKEISSRFLFSFFKRLWVSVLFFGGSLLFFSLFEWSLDQKYMITVSLYVISMLIFYFYKYFKMRLAFLK